MLAELGKLKTCVDEDELIKLAEIIGDKISFNGYNQEQIISLVQGLLDINLLSLSYNVREQILNVLCDATAHYNIRSRISWDRIIDIKDDLEEDLLEYAEELLCDEHP